MQQIAERGCGMAHFFVAGKAVRTKAQPFSARVGDDPLLPKQRRQLCRARQLDGEKCAVARVSAGNAVYSCTGEIFAQQAELTKAIGAKALDSHGKCELLATARLVPGENRRRGLEECVASALKDRWIGALVSELVRIGKPSSVERAEIAI